MRVLVTGGAGFIGSHVVDTLLAGGNEVVVLDDLSSGSLSNLRGCMNNPALRFIRGDIRDEKTVWLVLEGVETVIHEAALISVPLSIEKPELVRSVNVGGTKTLLEGSLAQGVRKFIYASSCAVFGEQEKLPISEDAVPKPLSPYAKSKLEAELECQKFHKKGLETVCLRYFNVYGPRQTAGEYAGVMVKFAERLRNDEPPIIYGDGEQTRDFVHVSDVVNATSLALEREGVAGEVINVGSGKATSINELCGIFLKIAGKTHLEPVHEPPKPGDIRRSQADLAKAGKLLGFEPRVSLEVGVREVLGR